MFSLTAGAQQKSGKIYDAETKEPLAGVNIKAANNIFLSTSNGAFSIADSIETIEISIVGYTTELVHLTKSYQNIALQKNSNKLMEVIVSANRTSQLRSEAPVAIATIGKQTMEDTKAQRMDQLINKVSGVFMVNLGNEQHEMSIRQPMTTKSMFLYMEDGIPIRTTGVYNHNALLEMNIPAAKSIEVIKGPSSALYGAEAIGGAVNIITQSAPAVKMGQLSVQMNDKAYKRADLQAGGIFGKLGVAVSGYYANKKNGPVEMSDFNKSAITLRTDYHAGDNTNWTNTFAWVDYYSDMTGALDSLKFAQKNYSSLNTFTYRKVAAFRYKSMLTHEWNTNSQTSLSLLFRDNSIKQNPSYSISSTSISSKFKGQINENSFKTYALFANHSQKINWLNSKIIAGASVDFSPQNYYAKFISITKDLSLNKYVSYYAPAVDSFLSKYKTGIVNLASYFNYECSPAKNFKFVAALRYDAFQYYFINSLTSSSSVSTASTINSFDRLTPKLGLTYNYKGLGFYTNYSEGYVPPQLTELYSAVKEAPYLLPQSFRNVELGGWASLLKNRIYLDWSIYQLAGTNEIISVKQPDNSYVNQNAGSTKHVGIEYGITYKPISDLNIRFSGTNAKHSFVTNIVKGVDYSGKEMSAAPKFTGNAEITYKPSYIKGLRISAEWQHQSAYYMDDLNKFTYQGFDVLNTRIGYQKRGIEVWVNALNITNSYYSVFSSKNATSSGNSSYAYTLGDPREITIGLAYHFKKNK
jgi:outer membrane receptor protein involved in Fe transport